MESKQRRFFIDALGVEKGKAYGFNEYLFNLLNFFFEHRNEIQYDEIVILCNKSQETLFSKYKPVFLVKGYNTNSSFRMIWVRTMFPIREKLNDNDLLFEPGNYSGLIKRSPILLVIHDLLFKRRKWLKNKLMILQRELSVPISIKHADVIVGISDFTSADIKHYYPYAAEKIRTIHNCFNFNKYKYDTLPSNYIIEEKTFFLVISTTAVHKNVGIVIKAFADYCKNGGVLDLVFVGRLINPQVVSIYNGLHSSIKDRIHIVSRVSDQEMSDLYHKASAYISASLFEGLGMPIVEAMYFNLPVLLTDDVVFREASMNLGEYFNPLDSEELMHKMLTLDLTKKKYGELIADAYSAENTAGRYINTINELYCQNNG